MGNPWHLDYRYRFSPDLSLRYIHDAYDQTLLSQEELDLDVHVEDATYQFFTMQVAESVGTVDIQRHRKNGYQLMASYAYALGFGGTSSNQTLNLKGEYHKTFNPWLQLMLPMRERTLPG
jgi:hypothetical protein